MTQFAYVRLTIPETVDPMAELQEFYTRLKDSGYKGFDNVITLGEEDEPPALLRQMQQVEDVLGKRDAECAELRDRCSGLRRQITAITSAREHAESELKVTEEQNRALQRRIDDQTRVLEERVERINQLKLDLASRTAEIAGMDRAIEERQDMFNDVVDARDRALARERNLKKQVEKLDLALEDLASQVREERDRHFDEIDMHQLRTADMVRGLKAVSDYAAEGGRTSMAMGTVSRSDLARRFGTGR